MLCCRRTASRQDPAIHGEGGARDPTRLLARQEQHSLDYILGLPVPTHRMEGVHRVEHRPRLLGRHEALVGGGLDERESHRVHPYVVLGELDREVLGEGVTPRLGRRVGAGGVVAMASTAHIDPTLTIAPPPRFFISGTAACEV